MLTYLNDQFPSMNRGKMKAISRSATGTVVYEKDRRKENRTRSY